MARYKALLSVREYCVFSMLGALMYVSKELMEVLPNIHLLGMLIIVYTLVYRFKALIPIYLYVFLDGVFSGFSLWWFPYLYIWILLWGAVMLLPRKMPKWLAAIIYPTLCALHGLLFGILYAPAQAIMFGLNFTETLAWIASGFAFDMIHGASNFCSGLLVFPFTKLLLRLEGRADNRF